MPHKILVLDAAQRSALAVTRSLGQAAHVTTAEATQCALAGSSRFSQVYVQCPSSEKEPQAFLNWIGQYCQEHSFDWVIPVTEITSQLLLMNAKQLPQVQLAFAPYERVMQLADKGNLMKIAGEAGVLCPKSTWLANADALDKSNIVYPAVLKPCLSKIFLGDHWLATQVRIVNNAQELETTLEKDTFFRNFPFMLQEFIPGHGGGIFCLCRKGQPLAFFAHERLREKPPQGGVSVLSQSVALDPQLRDAATKLLNQAQWDGVAMVEFRISPEGKAYLMEVNTRFWGSLQLAIDSGVDFPKLLIQAFGESTIEQTPNYRIGQKLRWFLGDFDSLYLYLKSRYTIGQKLKRVLAFFTPRFHCRHEVNRLGDLGPAWFELKLYVKQLIGK